MVWMFPSRQTNNMINKLHERVLKIVLLKGCLLKVGIFATIIELFKNSWRRHTKYRKPPVMETMFEKKIIPYNLGSPQEALHEKWRFPLRISSVNDQIRSFLWIWWHLLKKSLMENIFCVEFVLQRNRTINYDAESWSNRLRQLWALVVEDHKQIIL